MKRCATELFSPKESSWDHLAVAGQRRATAPVPSTSNLRAPAVLTPPPCDPLMPDASTDILFGDVLPPSNALPNRGSIFGEISRHQPSAEAGAGWKVVVSRPPPPPPLSEIPLPSPIGGHVDYSPMQAMLNYRFGSTAPPSSASSCQCSPSGILKSGQSPTFPTHSADPAVQQEGRPPVTPGKVRRVSILDSAQVAEG
eukprot:GGOE01046731.1.p1 GENE.GGOE01046731.1~~GGOE01046731.1.p1  ORF type:complete len:198 (+),score=21.04 GGOE01046731.1:81-674(+)